MKDGASYSTKLCREIIEEFPSLFHLQCLNRNINLLCDEIRKKKMKTIDFIVELKKMLNKNNRQMWRQITKLPYPNLPMFTRWETRIEFVSYLHRNLLIVQKY